MNDEPLESNFEPDEEDSEFKDDDAGDSDDGELNWVVMGQAPDRITADYIIESLKSYEIPVALNSKSGFLGDAGLTSISSIFGSGRGAYEILTVSDKIEEALEIAKMVGGDHWEPIEKI